MTAYEAISLFKKDCGKDGWRRLVRRYYTRNCQTVVLHIIDVYKPTNSKDVKALLMDEITSSANAINRQTTVKRLKTETE